MFTWCALGREFDWINIAQVGWRIGASCPVGSPCSSRGNVGSECLLVKEGVTFTVKGLLVCIVVASGVLPLLLLL